MKYYRMYGATCYSFEAPVGKDQIVRVEFVPEEDDSESPTWYHIGLLVYDKRKRNHTLNRWFGLVNLDEDGDVRGEEYPITGHHQLETFGVARKLFFEGIEAIRCKYRGRPLTFSVETTNRKRARVYDKFLKRYGWEAGVLNESIARYGGEWRWFKEYVSKNYKDFLAESSKFSRKENDDVELEF